MTDSFLGLNDILFAPIYLAMIVLGSMIITRKVLKDPIKRKYFVSGLTVRVLSSIIIGLIYQFYYGYGDNIGYFRDSLKLTDACLHNPTYVLDIFLFRSGEFISEISQHTQGIYFYQDPAAYFVVKVAAFLNFFSYSSYVCTSILFSLIGFSGSWALFITLIKMNNKIISQMATASFFIPSVVLWSSGILKDTLTYAALCWLIYAFYNIVVERKTTLRNIIILLLSAYVIYVVKIYIIICAVPCLMLWLYFSIQGKIRSKKIKTFIKPLLAVIAIIGAIYSTIAISQDSSRYSLDKISETSEITANYIYITSVNNGGSAYTLGDIEYTTSGLLRIFPAGVNVTLFRPYLWEARGIFPFLAAIESLWTLILTLRTLMLARFKIFKIVNQHGYLVFSLLFSILFAFAIGISSFNFGALHRYKIPLMPFYFSALYLIVYYSKKLIVENEAKKRSRNPIHNL